MYTITRNLLDTNMRSECNTTAVISRDSVASRSAVAFRATNLEVPWLLLLKYHGYYS